MKKKSIPRKILKKFVWVAMALWIISFIVWLVARLFGWEVDFSKWSEFLVILSGILLGIILIFSK